MLARGVRPLPSRQMRHRRCRPSLGYAALQEHLREHPEAYRTIDGFTPSQHEKAFYEAFGIRAGDRMWLDPSDRVTIW